MPLTGYSTSSVFNENKMELFAFLTTQNIATTWWGSSFVSFSWLARKEDHHVVFSCKASNHVGDVLVAPYRMSVMCKLFFLVIL